MSNGQLFEVQDVTDCHQFSSNENLLIHRKGLYEVRMQRDMLEGLGINSMFKVETIEEV